MSEPDLHLHQPVLGATQLVRRQRPEVLTSYRETDSRTALTRALKEYVEQLQIVLADGRVSRFLKVMQTWAEPEVPQDFPSAVVYSSDAGQYEARGLAVSTDYVVDEGRQTIRTVAELSLGLTVEVWTSDPVERMAMCAMLEDAFDPVGWMAGFVLFMPHYHGAHAHFEKVSMTYVDSVDAAMKRRRLAIFTLNANTTQYVVNGEVPELKVSVQVDAAAAGDS